MKNITLTAFLISCIFACTPSDKVVSSDPSSENVRRKSNELIETVPESKEPDLPKDYSLPNKLKYTKVNGSNIPTHFYPIGWSFDGNFAFIREPADEACGCYFFDLVIMDMLNDRVIWEWNYNDEGEGATRSTVWGNNYTLLKNRLLENKIIPSEGFTLEPLTFAHKNNQYAIKYSTQKNADWDFGNIEKFKIELTSSDLGRKTLTSGTYDEFDMRLEFNVSGVLKSPFEDRVIVVYSELIRGYEGPPNITNFGLSGGHLRTGFN